MSTDSDFLLQGSLASLDPAMSQLIDYEAERQARKLILIPSESSPPGAVREALGSVLQNIYAEGYPHPATREQHEARVLNYERQLTNYRRYSDLRYYKGVEYADIERLWRGGVAPRPLRRTTFAPMTFTLTCSRSQVRQPTMPSTLRWSSPARQSWACP